MSRDNDVLNRTAIVTHVQGYDVICMGAIDPEKHTDVCTCTGNYNMQLYRNAWP